MKDSSMTHRQSYANADRAILHYQRLIAGHLSPAERRHARVLLLRAVFARALARQAMEQTEEIAA